MVKLLFDVGNSRCKCARYCDGGLHCYPPVAVGADEIASCIPMQADGAIAEILIASVRGDEFNRDLLDALTARFKVRPVLLAAERAACGVTTAYRKAASLGADRFFALIGAWRRVGGHCVVADCGTAVTVDVLNANGVHQGGLIMPGLRLLQDSLGRGAKRLPAPGENGDVGTDETADLLFARDTESAISSGCHRMFTTAVLDAMRAMRMQLTDDGAGDAVLLTTGGDGSVPAATSVEIQYHPHLVLEGIAAFSERAADCG